MVQDQTTNKLTTTNTAGARQWSSRRGAIGAALTLLIPLALLVLGWALRDVPNLPVPQLRPGKLPPAHWETKAALPAPLADFGLVAAGDRLWAVGGVGGPQGGAVATTTVYTPATNQWQAGPTLPAARSNLAVVALGSTIYAFGGLNEAQAAINTADALATNGGQWQAIAPLPVALAGAAATTVGDAIYLVGGKGSAGAVNTVYRYLPATNSWNAVAAMPTPRYDLQAVTFQDKLYALGGIVQGEASTLVEVFDPATGQWTSGPAMLGPMADFAATVFNGRIHALAQDVHQVYDPRADKWVTASPMPTVRQGQGAATLGEAFYVAGGFGDSATNRSAQVEAFLLGEAEEPDTFRITGFDRGGAIAVIAGLITTVVLMVVMLRVGRRRPVEDDEPPADTE